MSARLNDRLNRIETVANATNGPNCTILLPYKKDDGNPPGSRILIEHPSGHSKIIPPDEVERGNF
jgi:hypothetical protein